MKKLLFAAFVLILAGYFVQIFEDKACLQNDIIRLHVVAHSDNKEDQELKIALKDAIVQYLQTKVPLQNGIDYTKQYLQDHLNDIEKHAKAFLEACGCNDTVQVSLEKEPFPKRVYETFTLPSGMYHSLRVTIGNGEGRNWWCVIFPTLCVGKTQQEYRDLAVGAGFSEQLIDATVSEGSGEIRFYLLDCLGKLEKLFYFERHCDKISR